MERCESCGKEIGLKEVSHLWADEVVTCGACGFDPRKTAEELAFDLCEQVDSEWHTAHDLLKTLVSAIGYNALRDASAPEKLFHLLCRQQDGARAALKKRKDSK